MICTTYCLNILSVSHRKINKFSFFMAISVIVLAVLLTGCGTSYKVKPDLIKGFKEPSVAANKTGLYVIRGSNILGAARGLWVAVNDKVVADLSNSSHVYLELDSGLNTLHFVQATVGTGYLAVDNKPGAILYAIFGYATTNVTKFLDEDIGKSIVMQTNAVTPLKEKLRNDAYDNLMINPGVLAYPIMVESSEELKADEINAVVRFYRPDRLIAKYAFDIWNQEG